MNDNPETTGRHVWFLALLLFAFSLLVYVRTLGNDFVWDDEGMFVHNPAIRSFANLPGFFLAAEDFGTSTAAANIGQDVRYYRPLLGVVHVLEYQFFGASPLGYKLVNWLLNGVLVTGAFLLAGSILGNWTKAFWGTLLYSVLPARAEVVYWVYSDSHVFAAVFTVFALLAWHKNRNWLASSLMGIGLLFQEGVVLLLPLLFLYELVLHADKLRERWPRLLFPFMVVVGYLALRLSVVGAESSAALHPLSVSERLQAALFLVAGMWRNLVWPEGLATVFIFRPGMFDTWDMVDVARLVLLLFCIAWGGLLWRWRREYCFWYLWLYAWIGLGLLVGPVGEYLLSEKSLYLASLGPCIMLTGLLTELPCRRTVLVALSLLTIIYAGRTWQRSAAWSDTVTYLQTLLAYEPEFAIGHLALAGKQMELNDFTGAEASFLEVLRHRPENTQLHEMLLKCYDQQVFYLSNQGELQSALAVLEKSLRRDPSRSQTWNGLGIVRYQSADYPGARQAWERAVALDSDNVEAQKNLDLVRRGNKNELGAR